MIVSRRVTQLVQRGLLANRRQPANKRVSLLRLTESGEQVYAQARTAGQRYNTEFAACLTDDEARLLEIVLSKLEARAQELNQREIALNVDRQERDIAEE